MREEIKCNKYFGVDTNSKIV